MRAIGEVRKRFTGDTRVAQSYLGFARKLLGFVKEQAAFQGLPQLVRRFKLPEGIVIQCATVFGQDEIQIFAPPGTVENTVLVCRTRYDGLVEILSKVDTYPDNPQTPVPALHRYSEKGSTTPWVDSPELLPLYPGYKNAIPSKFSGEMRKVVQMLHAQNIPVTFSYSAARTNGIFVAQDNKRWIIEINPNGIFAAPMEICEVASEEDLPTALPYIPVTGSFPAEYIQLATASEVAPYFSKTPFYGSCGWAFSESGKGIKNVVWGWSGAWRVAYLYSIKITSNVLTGAPASASMIEEDSGWLWGDRVTHMKYPLDDINLKSFDLFYGQFTPPPDNVNAPVFTYYDGETSNTIYYVNDHLNGTGPVESGDPTPFPAWPDDDPQHLAGGHHHFSGSRGPAPHFSTEGSVTIESGSSSNQDYSTPVLRGTIVAGTGAGPVFEKYPAVFLVTKTIYTYSKFTTHSSVLLIPANDRQAYYQYSRNRTIAQESVVGQKQDHTGVVLQESPGCGSRADGDVTAEDNPDLPNTLLFTCVREASPTNAVNFYNNNGVPFMLFSGHAVTAGDTWTEAQRDAAPLTTAQELGFYGSTIITGNNSSTKAELKLVMAGVGTIQLPLDDDDINGTFPSYTAFVTSGQRLFVVKDAMNEQKYIASGGINKDTGSQWLTNAGSYPVNTLGLVNFGFIGEPH